LSLILFVKIALALIIFWLTGPIVSQDLDADNNILPVIATIMIIISDHRRRMNNSNRIVITILERESP